MILTTNNLLFSLGAIEESESKFIGFYGGFLNVRIFEDSSLISIWTQTDDNTFLKT